MTKRKKYPFEPLCITFASGECKACPKIVQTQANRLTFKAPITTAADGIYKYFFILFSEKIILDISCESSARQRIHMEHQALFPFKDKSKKLNCRLLQFLFGASLMLICCPDTCRGASPYLRIFCLDGAVPCGGRKTSPVHHHCADYIFWSFVII